MRRYASGAEMRDSDWPRIAESNFVFLFFFSIKIGRIGSFERLPKYATIKCIVIGKLISTSMNISMPRKEREKKNIKCTYLLWFPQAGFAVSPFVSFISLSVIVCICLSNLFSFFLKIYVKLIKFDCVQSLSAFGLIDAYSLEWSHSFTIVNYICYNSHPTNQPSS